MKKKFLNYSLNLLKKENKYDDGKIAELMYGLEAFYMISTKLIVVIAIAIYYNIFLEFLLFLILYTPLRGFGFGFHANNSIQCWLISLPVFIGIPLLAKNIIINQPILQVIMILSITILLIFAPADTKYKPLINERKRLVNKYLVVITSLIYLILSLFITNNLVLNLIVFACIYQSICVNPIVYRLFKQTFNNYKNYQPITV